MSVILEIILILVIMLSCFLLGTLTILKAYFRTNIEMLENHPTLEELCFLGSFEEVFWEKCPSILRKMIK